METKIHKRIAKSLKKIESIMITGETTTHWAAQNRIFALFHRRTMIVLTDSRIIWVVRNLFGGFYMLDVRWQDLKDVRIVERLFGIDLYFYHYPKKDLVINNKQTARFVLVGLDKEQARLIYRVAQGNEQIWREKRRVREIEEIRAHTGNVQVSGGHFSGDTQQPQESSVKRLQEAKAMLDGKLITDVEYETIKAKIISNI